MNNQLLNNGISIYLVFTSQDKEVATAIENFLGKAGIGVIRYDMLPATDDLRQYYFTKFRECSYVLIILSNNWRSPSKLLDMELNHLISYAARERIGRFVYMVRHGNIGLEVSEKVSSFGFPDELTSETLTRYIQEFREPPKKKRNGTGSLSNVPKIRPPAINHFGTKPLLVPVTEYMTKTPFTYKKGDDLAALTWDNDRRHIRHFPIVDEEDKLIGLVSLRDILRQEPPDEEVLRYLAENDENTQMPIFEMYEPLSVESFMTPHLPESPIACVLLDAHIGSAIELMAFPQSLSNGKHFISALPVIDSSDYLTGIVSYMDILEKYESLPMEESIMKFCKGTLRTVNENAPLSYAAEQMRGVRDAVVVDDNGEAVGMLSDYEILKNQHERYNTDRVPVKIIMKKPLFKYPCETDSIALAIKIFRKNAMIGAIAVLEENSRQPIGIVSYVDVLRYLLNRE